ncbi:FecR domain-containing protein [Rhodocyclus tenuis]|uniref:FecR domain-containing protein n=1 Tax=Rhodocyclus gracilis TaxID=2929842 RepID=A0ABX0WKN9_9RHOO|nr:FecR domain-containing protein [Rhodocyclus gracilis]NJA90122.1 FecR domain-containing protein [Rhodocyclus gracilis]
MMRSVLMVLALLGASLCWGDENAIGYVKNLTGEASVTTKGVRQKADVGTPVLLGSVLRTGAHSSMGVTFKDETVMSFGADTEFAVDDYLYAPAQGKLKLASKLTRGSLNYVSGVIAKLQPEAVTVTTPTGTIGVRGTQFLVKVEE